MRRSLFLFLLWLFFTQHGCTYKPIASHTWENDQEVSTMVSASMLNLGWFICSPWIFVIGKIVSSCMGTGFCLSVPVSCRQHSKISHLIV